MQQEFPGRTGENKSLYALDFIEYTVTRMSAKSAGKTRLGNSGLVRQAAIPVRVGISNGRHRIRKLRLQSTFRHRPIRLPRRPTVGHFGLVTYHNRLLHRHESFPFFNHHFRPRFTSPHPHLANTRIARRRGPFRVPLVSNTDRKRTVHACCSILQRKIWNLFLFFDTFSRNISSPL